MNKLLLLLLFFCSSVEARTAVFQAKESTATVNNPAKCPGNPDATFSRSIWNRGGWPLFQIVCWYKEAK